MASGPVKQKPVQQGSIQFTLSHILSYLKKKEKEVDEDVSDLKCGTEA